MHISSTPQQATYPHTLGKLCNRSMVYLLLLGMLCCLQSVRATSNAHAPSKKLSLQEKMQAAKELLQEEEIKLLFQQMWQERKQHIGSVVDKLPGGHRIPLDLCHYIALFFMQPQRKKVVTILFSSIQNYYGDIRNRYEVIGPHYFHVNFISPKGVITNFEMHTTSTHLHGGTLEGTVVQLGRRYKHASRNHNLGLNYSALYISKMAKDKSHTTSNQFDHLKATSSMVIAEEKLRVNFPELDLCTKKLSRVQIQKWEWYKCGKIGFNTAKCIDIQHFSKAQRFFGTIFCCLPVAYAVTFVYKACQYFFCPSSRNSLDNMPPLRTFSLKKTPNNDRWVFHELISKIEG